MVPSAIVKLRHPLSGDLYERQEDGLVRVEREGRFGLFHPDGRWHAGELREADIHLLLWVGGPHPERPRRPPEDAP